MKNHRISRPVNRYDITKTEAQRKHAKRRALERYGLVLNRDDLDAALESIHKKNSVYVGWITNRLTVHDVIVKGVLCRVCLDKNRNNICTFLPINSVRNINTIDCISNFDQNEFGDVEQHFMLNA